MFVSGIRMSFLTRQSAIFVRARRDAAIFAPERVACPLWTSSPRRAKRLFRREYPLRRIRGVNGF